MTRRARFWDGVSTLPFDLVVCATFLVLASLAAVGAVALLAARAVRLGG